MHGGWFYYMLGNTLTRFQPNASTSMIAGNIRDYTIDTQNNVIYVTSNDGIYSMDISGNYVNTVINASAQQVLLCNGVVYYRQDGMIYRVNNGVSALVSVANASWFGVYRDKLYYINGNALYVCDTNGQNARLFDAGPVATVSFVAGNAYLGSTSGGGFNRMVPTP